MARSLTAIQTDLDLAYESRRAALEAESYTVDSGQGRQSATRNLANINKTIKLLEEEHREAEQEANGDGAIALTFARR